MIDSCPLPSYLVCMSEAIRKLEQSLPIQLLATHDKVMRYFRPTLKKHKLTDQKWRILRFIAQNEGAEFHVVAKACLLKRASLSRTLVSLEKSGWVERYADQDDRRQVCLKLTEQGHHFHSAVAIDFSEVFDSLDEKLGNESQLILTSLRKIQELL